MNRSHRTNPLMNIVLMLALVVIAFAPTALADDTKVQPSRERFVPVDQLDTILKQTPSGILLPKTEFQDLLLKARKAVGEASPGDAVITSASYQLSAEEHRALIELTLQFRQFQDGWTTQTIPIGNLQPESATLNGESANVGISTGQPGRFIILNDEAGTFELKVLFSTALLKSGTDRSVVFTGLDNGPATLNIDCPAGEHVIVNRRKLNRSNELDQPTTYSVPIGHTPGKPSDVRITWTTRRQQEISDNLVFAKSMIEASLNPSGLKWHCESRLSIFGQKIDRLSASVPATLEITNVESAGLEQWTLEDDPDSKDRIRLQLKYRQPFAQDRLIRIAAVSTLSLQDTNAPVTASSKIPTLNWNNLTAHTGQVAVQTELSQRLLTEPISGLGRTTNQQRTSREIVLQADNFDFWKQDFDLQVKVRPKDRELFSKIDSILYTADTSVTFQSSLTIETLNEPLFDVIVEAPEDWQIQNLTDSSSTQLPWNRTADGKSILIDLPKPIEAGELLTVRLLATRTIDDPAVSQTLPLPVVRVKNAIQAGATYAMSCANDLKISFPNLNGLVPIADSKGRLVFEAQTSAYGGAIQIDRKTARLATRAELRTWMEPDTVSTSIDLTVDVVNGSTRNLTVNLPESLTAAVRFQLRAIAQVPGQIQEDVPSRIQIIEQTDLPVQDGVRPFRLTFDKRFVGSINLYATIKIDRNEDFEWLAPFVRINEAARQQGIIVFEARPEQQLSVIDQAKVKGVAVADASMVPACDVRSGRRVAMVFRYVVANYSLAIEETTFATQTVPSAVCQSIQNVVVYDAQKSVQRSAKIDFQTSGVQTLRFRLPTNSYLWSTVLDGKAVQVRRDATDYLVALPLPDRGSANQSHQLKVLFESQTSESGKKEVIQDSVALLIDTNQGPSTNIEILQQSWKLSYPKTVSLTEIPSGFQLENGTPSQGWIQSVVAYLRTYRPPSNQLMVGRAMPVGLVLLALFVLTVLVSRRRWKTLLGLCIAVGAVGSLTFSTPVTSRMLMTENTYKDAIDTPAKGMAIADESADLAQQNVQPGDGSMMLPRETTGGIDGGYGGFGGGFGGGFDEAASGFAGGKEIEIGGGQNAPVISDMMFDGTTNANQQVNDDPFAEELVVPEVHNTGNDVSQSITLGRNSALLSVKANVANPDHFLSAEFRSINSNATDQSFPVQLQSAQVRQALMIMAASLVILLCLYFSKTTIVARLTFTCFLLLTVAALVPLLTIRWQPVADGLFFGIIAGISLWICLGLARLCASCCRPNSLVQLGNLDGRQRQSTSTAAMIFLLTCAGIHSASAQESAANQQAQALPNQAAFAEAAAIDFKDSNNSVQPDVILPYQPGQPELLADQVFLPKDQFLKLYRLANPNQLPAIGSNHDAQVVAAYYKSGKVKNTETAQWVQDFKARFVVTTFTNQPTTVPLPLRKVSLISATLQLDAAKEGQPALMTPTPNGGLEVKVEQKGVHILDLVFRVVLQKKGSTGQVQLNLLPVATGTIEYELSADKLKVTVNDQVNGHRRSDRNVLVPISSGGPFQIRWAPEGSQKARNTFFHVDSKSAVSVSDQGIATVSAFQITVRQGTINRIKMDLPDADSILAVDGANISGWQTVKNGDQNELTIDFLQPVSGQDFVTVNRFRKAVIDTTPVDFQIPIPSVIGATRDSGTVAVLVENGFDVRVHSLSSVSQIDTTSVQLPDLVQTGSQRIASAFRYTRQPAVVALKIGRNSVRRTVDLVNAVQVDLQRQRWTTLVRTNTNGTAVRQLRIALPNDFLVLDVQANGIEDWYINDSENTDSENTDTSKRQRLLMIQLSQARTGTVNAVIQGQTGRSGNGRLETLIGPALPENSLTEQDRYSGQLHVWLDDTSEISSIQADQWKRVPAGTSASTEVRKLNSAAPAVSFTSTNESASEIKLNLRKAAPSLLAESVLVTNVTDTSLELSLALNWQISRAAGADFSFSIPSTLADVLDFRIPGLRQMDQQLIGTQTKYTIRLQQPVSNSFFAMGTATLPLPPENRIRPFDIRFAIADASEAILSSQSHYWVLVNQSAGLLQLADINSQPLEVEPSELKTKIPAGFLQQSVSIQRCKANGKTPAWKLSFPESEQVTPAVISLAAHRLIIAEDGSWKSHHSLQVRNEGRQFLPITLPQNSQFLSCMVKGQPSRIVIQQTTDGVRSLIPIPQSGRLSTVFNVEFLLAGQLNIEPTNLAGQPLDLPLPGFPEFRDDPKYGITVARNTLKLFTPKSWHTSAVDDPRMTNVVKAQKNDLEDAQLLSAVDNLRNLIDSAKSSNVRLDDVQLQTQFFNQTQILDTIKGNSGDAVSQRNELLNEVRNFSDNSLMNGSQMTGGQGGTNAFLRQQQSREPIWGNTILQELDLNQNRFNIDNNDSLYTTNGAQGVVVLPQSERGKADRKFNFKLPELAAKKRPASDAKSPSKNSKGKGKPQSQSQPQSSKKSGTNRSKLMLQQTEAAAAESQPVQIDQWGLFDDKQNSQRLPEQDMGVFGSAVATGSLRPSDRSRMTFGLQPNAPSTLNTMPNNSLGIVGQESQNAQFGDEFNINFNQNRAGIPEAKRSGLLSLNFELPESGTESDFIRTGGNPKLTLKVRSAKQVETSYSWIWAAICLLLFLCIRRIVSKSSDQIATQLLWLGLLLAFAGCVSLPDSGSIACLIATVLLAVVISAVTIYRSFIKPGMV